MYKETINKLKPFKYSDYSNITSNEKLAIYACYQLLSKEIPLTFNYICIASFKLFPDKFYFDEEFKEYPHIEKLNRTILHLHNNKNSSLLIGSARNGYQMTKAGLIIAKQVELDITNKNKKVVIKKTIVDDHKKGTIQSYEKMTKNDYYISFDIDNDFEIDLDFVWKYFDVIPFTNINYIKRELKELKTYSRYISDKKLSFFLSKILDKLNF